MSRKQVLMAIVSGVMSLGVAGYASAQDNSGGNPPPGNAPGDQGQGRQRRFGGDPAQWRQQAMDRMKEQLGASDDEWKVIEPRLDKVMTLQRDTRMSGMGFMFGFGRSSRGGDRGQQSQGEQSAVQRAAADLRSALEDKSISADEIAKRLATYRQAKDQAKQDLVKAQADLKELLSQRQEATLVMAGMLD